MDFQCKNIPRPQSRSDVQKFLMVRDENPTPPNTKMWSHRLQSSVQLLAWRSQPKYYILLSYWSQMMAYLETLPFKLSHTTFFLDWCYSVWLWHWWEMIPYWKRSPFKISQNTVQYIIHRSFKPHIYISLSKYRIRLYHWLMVFWRNLTQHWSEVTMYPQGRLSDRTLQPYISWTGHLLYQSSKQHP